LCRAGSSLSEDEEWYHHNHTTACSHDHSHDQTHTPTEVRHPYDQTLFGPILPTDPHTSPSAAK
jgi:hypothetical protein